MPKPHQVGFMPKLYQTAAIEHVAETRKGHITNPACVKTNKKNNKKNMDRKHAKSLKCKMSLKMACYSYVIRCTLKGLVK